VSKTLVECANLTVEPLDEIIPLRLSLLALQEDLIIEGIDLVLDECRIPCFLLLLLLAICIDVLCNGPRFLVNRIKYGHLSSFSLKFDVMHLGKDSFLELSHLFSLLMA